MVIKYHVFILISLCLFVLISKMRKVLQKCKLFHVQFVNTLIIPPLTEWWVYWNTLVHPFVCPSLNLVYVTSHLSFVGFYSYLVSWLTMI